MRRIFFLLLLIPAIVSLAHPFLFFDTFKGLGFGYDLGNVRVWGGYPYLGTEFSVDLVLLNFSGDIGIDPYFASRGWTELKLVFGLFGVEVAALTGTGYDLTSVGDQEPSLVGNFYYGAEIGYIPPQGLSFALRIYYPFYEVGYLKSSQSFLFYPMGITGNPIPVSFKTQLSYKINAFELGASYKFSLAGVAGYPSPLINLAGVSFFIIANE